MLSKPYYFCYRELNEDKYKILDHDSELLNDFPSLFGVDPMPEDSYSGKDNRRNVLQCVNLVNEENIS